VPVINNDDDAIAYWNDAWVSAQKANRASGRGRECWEAWDEEADARAYWQRVSARASGRVDEFLSMIGPDWSVLDIGAGPGNLSVPLAAKAARVTAVEPARGMGAVLRENAEARGLANIDIVAKTWDAVDPAADLAGPYDLVVASYSLGMLDLLESLRKILAVARREVVLYWHAGPQAWDVDAARLWPLLHGRGFHPIPKADVVFNLLYAMGVYPDVRVIPSSFRTTFPSMDRAMAEYGARFGVAPDDEARNRLLRDYLEAKLIEENGALAQRARNTGMRISWTVKGNDNA